jgi:hypothetical protein
MDVYKVWVTQYCQPFDVVASDADEAKRIASEDMTWEPISIDVEVEKIS